VAFQQQNSGESPEVGPLKTGSRPVNRKLTDVELRDKRRTLKLAFSDNAYERFKSKVGHTVALKYRKSFAGSNPRRGVRCM
jgi:hypothetical protein